eukprot:COSAG01_NODE_1542_length_9973_cov_11.546992_9_plen_82_part_00
MSRTRVHHSEQPHGASSHLDQLQPRLRIRQRRHRINKQWPFSLVGRMLSSRNLCRGGGWLRLGGGNVTQLAGRTRSWKCSE